MITLTQSCLCECSFHTCVGVVCVTVGVVASIHPLSSCKVVGNGGM
jgi:hypothetical protein